MILFYEGISVVIEINSVKRGLISLMSKYVSGASESISEACGTISRMSGAISEVSGTISGASGTISEVSEAFSGASEGISEVCKALSEAVGIVWIII